jgi:hypothetical protein
MISAVNPTNPHQTFNNVTTPLFTMSGNAPPAALKEDLDAASTNRDQFVVNLRIEDHQEFIKEMFEEAENLGDD